MTCCAAVKTADGVWIGSDSISVVPWNGDKHVHGSKIVSINDYKFAYTLTFHLENVLCAIRDDPTCVLKMPKTIASRADAWQAYRVIADHDLMKACVLFTDKPTKSDDLFEIKQNAIKLAVASPHGVWSFGLEQYVGSPQSGYVAVGCGDRYAEAVMYHMIKRGVTDGHEIVSEALEAAAANNAFVSAPFFVERVA